MKVDIYYIKSPSDKGILVKLDNIYLKMKLIILNMK